MQTSKISLAIGVTLVFSLSVRAADNDAQTKARQALEQQLNQTTSQPAPPPAQPPPAAPQTTKKTPATTAVAPASTQADAVPASAARADDQTIAKARDAMRQKINDLSTEPATPAPAAPAAAQVKAPPPPPPPPAAAPAAAAAAAAVAAEAPPKVVPPPPTETGKNLSAESETGASPEAIAKARAALREKVAELPVEPTEPASANEASLAKAREAMYDKMQQLPPYTDASSSGGMAQQFPALESPEMPISGAKVQRLHALLQQYKADQITPEQYQAQRARILAEP